MLQRLGSQTFQVPGAVFQQAFTLVVEKGEELHVVFSDGFKEELKRGEVSSGTDASC